MMRKVGNARAALCEWGDKEAALRCRTLAAPLIPSNHVREIYIIVEDLLKSTQLLNIHFLNDNQHVHRLGKTPSSRRTTATLLCQL
jgi:hypothetical protein